MRTSRTDHCTRRAGGRCAKPARDPMPRRPASVRLPEVLAPAGDVDSMRAAVLAGADAVYFGLLGHERARAGQELRPGRPARDDALSPRPGRARVRHAQHARLRRGARAPRGAGARVRGGRRRRGHRPGPRRRRSSCAPSRPGLPIHASTQMTCTDAAGVAAGARVRGRPRHPRARAVARGHRRDPPRDRRRARGLRARRALHRVLGAVPHERGHRRSQRQPRRVRAGVPASLRARRRRRPARPRRQGVPALAGGPRGERARPRAGARSASSRSRSRGASRGPSTSRRRRRSTGARSTRWRAAPGRRKKSAPRPSRCTRAARARASSTGSTTSGSSTGAPAITAASWPASSRGRAHASAGSAASRCWRRRRSRAATGCSSRATPRSADGSGAIFDDGGVDVERAPAGREVCVWLGPDRASKTRLARARACGRRATRRARSRRPRRCARRIASASTCASTARSASARCSRRSTERGARVSVVGDAPVEEAAHERDDRRDARARSSAASARRRSCSASLDVDLPEGVMVPLSSLNRARRAITEALAAQAAAAPPHATTAVADTRTCSPPRARRIARRRPRASSSSAARSRRPTPRSTRAPTASTSTSSSSSGRAAPFAPCGRVRRPRTSRSRPPASASRARRRSTATSRSSRPTRSWCGAWAACTTARTAMSRASRDFSLNVTNRLSAAAVLARGVVGVHARRSISTPSSSPRCSTPRWRPSPRSSCTIPMPLFHMEHCVIAALLSEGRDHKTCGRPCDRHAVSLRDRSGAVHPVEADVGCRNTVFHGAAQSAASLVPAPGRSWGPALPHRARSPGRLGRGGARRSLPRPDRRVADVGGGLARSEVLGAGAASRDGYGVVRGSLRVLP